MHNVPRWRATITYRADAGPIDVTFDVEELQELHDLVENGPDWNTIERVVIVLQRRAYPGDTIERAAER